MAEATAPQAAPALAPAPHLDREGLDRLAVAERFSGVVRIDRGGAAELAVAYGLAHRGWGIPNTVDTRFALASGSKSFTALAVVSLIEDGVLELDTTARSVLGPDLPLIDDRVTVGQLLAHRSGIGDYLDEDAGHELSEYVLTVPAQELDTTESFLVVLDGFPTAFPRTSASPTATAGSSCWPSSPSGRVVCRSTTSCSSASAIRRAWWTRPTCARMSSPAAPRWAT